MFISGTILICSLFSGIYFLASFLGKAFGIYNVFSYTTLISISFVSGAIFGVFYYSYRKLYTKWGKNAFYLQCNQKQYIELYEKSKQSTKKPDTLNHLADTPSKDPKVELGFHFNRGRLLSRGFWVFIIFFATLAGSGILSQINGIWSLIAYCSYIIGLITWTFLTKDLITKIREKYFSIAHK
ncbi:hypothetical protein [Helicobacter sp. 12S02634-8]|uniref:hypothetical protein n=1 Tax=Helicobacter sp. 12S02634-8 TaxID=1476199 RepID=UPI00117AEECB|nr:hypothetical protein [Helicobacter sp. 12S02634-8]